ncbi:hypothetical protein GOP47_0013651 [Adiantum capillus-veneris]|uniref:Uncharacterized protein n=1 Tax=Adiantum capillus-veneris TaxID=13818 RepID=A0A9D4UNY3_ADICA|nr:hypothetical protein GOP47_0013651 [Adiantum capillus-veneris]
MCKEKEEKGRGGGGVTGDEASVGGTDWNLFIGEKMRIKRDATSLRCHEKQENEHERRPCFKTSGSYFFTALELNSHISE